MVGCCKFGPCRKKRTYEFNNPPYSANKESGVYQSSKQKLAESSRDETVKNGSAHNPGFESESADNVHFNGAAVVDLDSECNSIAEKGTLEVRRNSKHKENKEGFKNADLVVASKGINRKDSKRSSKSSSSSSSSSSKSSKGSKRSSKHSDVAVVFAGFNHDKQYDNEETFETANNDEFIDANEIEATIVTTENAERELVEEVEGGAIAYHDDEVTHDHISVVKTEFITETIVGKEVTEEEEEVKDQDDETPSARRGSNSSSSSSSSPSSDAKSYQINEDEQQDNNKEDVPEEKEQASLSEDNFYEMVEAPPGLEELDNEANEMVQEFGDESYTVTVTQEVSVNAHGDDEEHEDLGSENL